jgi:hypothetical protein
MNAANRQPILNAQQQAQDPLNSRAPMSQKRLPHPERVWPRQVNVREEQR